MKIVYRVSEQDFVGARKLFISNEKPWYRRFSRHVLPWIGASVLVMQVVYLVVVPHRDIGFVVIGFIVGFYLLYCGLALPRYFRRAYQKDHRFKHDFTAEISDQGIHVVTPFRGADEMEQFCTRSGIERHLHAFHSAMELHPLSEARIRTRRGR